MKGITPITLVTWAAYIAALVVLYLDSFHWSRS